MCNVVYSLKFSYRFVNYFWNYSRIFEDDMGNYFFESSIFHNHVFKAGYYDFSILTQSFVFALVVSFMNIFFKNYIMQAFLGVDM